MPAVVKFKSYAQTRICYEFHVGTGKLYQENFQDVISVQCDGHELDHACKILGRSVEGKCHTFVGESAQEIIANW